MPEHPLWGRAARQVPGPAEHHVGRDVGCKPGSTAGFFMKRGLRHHERYAAELKAAELAETVLCSGN